MVLKLQNPLYFFQLAATGDIVIGITPPNQEEVHRLQGRRGKGLFRVWVTEVLLFSQVLLLILLFLLLERQHVVYLGRACTSYFTQGGKPSGLFCGFRPFVKALGVV